MTVANTGTSRAGRHSLLFVNRMAEAGPPGGSDGGVTFYLQITGEPETRLVV
jgi:hypothetical protein